MTEQESVEFIKFMALNTAKIRKAANEEADVVLGIIAKELGVTRVNVAALSAEHIRTLVLSSFIAGANYQAQWEEENS